MTATHPHPADAPDSDPSEASDETSGRGPLSRGIKVLALAAMAASFGLWGYAYSGLAERDTPDLLANPSFGPAAELVCEAATADVAALPNALDAVDGPDRAGQIMVATARFEDMVEELESLLDGDDRDRQILTDWLADWRVLLADRYRYADRIAQDPNAQFLITDTGVSERLDRRLTRLADTNDMPACGAPLDVG